MKHDALRERALANFDALLELWKITYRKITPNEYDIIASWRTDRDFGSCRFNIEKGRGADFAGGSLADEDFSKLGLGFNKEDFNSFSDEGQSKIGFDIIGLCQRIYHANSYEAGSRYLSDDIGTLSRRENFINPAHDAAERRAAESRRKQLLLVRYANDLWESSKYHTYRDSPGERYLQSRGINILDKNIRFHRGITYTPDKKIYPALLFKVQEYPTSELAAVHRIFLTHDGQKAKIDNPKMALASIKGKGIWFGIPGDTLAIAEGPENALSLLKFGHRFVVSTIYAGNFHNLKIPTYVKTIKLYPDAGPAGRESHKRAIESYKKYLDLGVRIEEYTPSEETLPNGKFADINDLLLMSI